MSVVFIANPKYKALTLAVGVGAAELSVPSDAKKYGEPADKDENPVTNPDA